MIKRYISSYSNVNNVEKFYDIQGVTSDILVINFCDILVINFWIHFKKNKRYKQKRIRHKEEKENETMTNKK